MSGQVFNGTFFVAEQEQIFVGTSSSCMLMSLILYTASVWVLRAVETSPTGQLSFPESSLVMPSLCHI